MPIAPVSLIIQPEKQNIYKNSKNYALATINTTDINIPVNTVHAKIVAISGSVRDESIPPVHIDIRDDIPVAPVINAQYFINIAAPFNYLSNITT